MTSAVRCIVCLCPEIQEQREMAFCGFEKIAGHLKYRCPVAVYDLDCKDYRRCHRQHGGQVSDNGRVVRVKLDKNRRIFTPMPRVTPPPGKRTAVSAPHWSESFRGSTKAAVSSGTIYAGR